MAHVCLRRISQQGGIKLLQTIHDRFVVCGCADGAVRFFDFQVKMRRVCVASLALLLLLFCRAPFATVLANRPMFTTS